MIYGIIGIALVSLFRLVYSALTMVCVCVCVWTESSDDGPVLSRRTVIARRFVAGSPAGTASVHPPKRTIAPVEHA